MGDRYNLNIQSEIELLKVQKTYLDDFASYNLELADTLEILMEIEMRITNEPLNGFLPRLRTFIRHQSQLTA